MSKTVDYSRHAAKNGLPFQNAYLKPSWEDKFKRALLKTNIELDSKFVRHYPRGFDAEKIKETVFSKAEKDHDLRGTKKFREIIKDLVT